jgi:hypothetical protein
MLSERSDREDGASDCLWTARGFCRHGPCTGALRTLTFRHRFNGSCTPAADCKMPHAASQLSDTESEKYDKR